MLKKLILLIATIALLPVSTALAGDAGKAYLAESMDLQGKQLLLNGAGLRKKFFIKVYAGGLYLEEKNSDAEAIINAAAPMAIRMFFIHSKVSKEKLIKGWDKGFAKATGNNIGTIRKETVAFNAMFTEDAHEGDTYDIIYMPGKGTEVIIKGISKGVIEGLYFKKALFAIWLGDDPADNSLKKGMLGK